MFTQRYFKEAAFYAEQFVPLHHEAKQEMQEMCFLSAPIEGAYLTCDVHAHSPSPRMHAEQNPTKDECFSPGMLSIRCFKREVSYLFHVNF